MGSYDEAIMTGFLCRFCSKLTTNVIHIYSDKGKDLNLAEKITNMPIAVFSELGPEDNLPKTICAACIIVLDELYQYMQNVRNDVEIPLLPADLPRERLNSTATEETQNCEHSTENCAVRSPNSNSK